MVSPLPFAKRPSLAQGLFSLPGRWRREPIIFQLRSEERGIPGVFKRRGRKRAGNRPPLSGLRRKPLHCRSRIWSHQKPSDSALSRPIFARNAIRHGSGNRPEFYTGAHTRVVQFVLCIWWAWRDSNPQPRDYESVFSLLHQTALICTELHIIFTISRIRGRSSALKCKHLHRDPKQSITRSITKSSVDLLRSG